MKNARLKQVRDEVVNDILDWNKDVLGLQEPLYRKYEVETGKSPVYWQSEKKATTGEDLCWHDTLPRDEEYTSNGDTEEYVKWVTAIVAKAIAEGAKTPEEIAKRIKEDCEVRR